MLRPAASSSDRRRVSGLRIEGASGAEPTVIPKLQRRTLQRPQTLEPLPPGASLLNSNNHELKFNYNRDNSFKIGPIRTGTVNRVQR